MAKSRRDARRGAKSVPVTTPATEAPATDAPTAAPPAKARPAKPASSGARTSPDASFWSGFTVSPVKLLLVRFALFGVLAFDAYLQLSHAPRYGSGFNVGNLRLLDDLAPGRDAFAATELALTFLFAAFALGAGLRLVPLAALLYNWVYFSSQLDSYQHHYLVSLILILACFVPWRVPAADTGPRRSWALRLILVQLGVMYLWAVIAKLHGQWLDGTALGQQISTPWMRSAIERVGWPTAATMTVLLEVLLAVGVWNRRLWPIVAPLGIGFHVAIEKSGLEIGLFSYVMVGLYLLALPEGWLAAIRAEDARAWVARQAQRLAPGTIGAAVALGLAAIAVALLLALSPLVSAVVVALAVAVTLGGALALRTPGRATAHALGCALAALLVFACGRLSTEVPEYYKFWAGSSRRLGRLDETRVAYTRLLEVKPDSAPAHYYLGTYDLADHHDDDALAHFRAAQAIDARDPRAFVAEARWLESQGKPAEALAKAKAGLAGRPGDADARALVDHLTSIAPAIAPSPAP
ncbi:MAG: HTTM domain-containing protein [Deltaproteobacteria bacterium]|nr:HTTM domain-containing protein [Deltaproteobacteria bacterium]